MKPRQDNHLNHQLCRLALMLAWAGVARCTQAQEPEAWPVPRPLGREIVIAPGVSPAETNGTLTLRAALELALARNPDLAAAAHGVRAAAADTQQAGAWPNPELEVEADEFGGTGPREGYDAAETTVRLTQPIELGGKRARRQDVARAEARLAGWEHEARRLDLITLTKQAFADVLLAQGQTALADELLGLAEDVRRTAAERVKSGKVPLLEETRAGVALATARVARDRAGRELDLARRRLAATWGGTTPAFAEAGGDLARVTTVPPLEILSARLDDAPEVARWRAEQTRATAAMALAQAERTPDLDLSIGVTRFEEDDSHAATAALALPLPVFDRRAGAIRAAQYEAARTAVEQQAARLRTTTALSDAYGRLETAAAESLAIARDVRPGAQQAFDAAQAGYREGKLGYLELLDAQRTLAETRARQLDALAACHRAVADLERLTGLALVPVQ